MIKASIVCPISYFGISVQSPACVILQREFEYFVPLLIRTPSDVVRKMIRNEYYVKTVIFQLLIVKIFLLTLFVD